MFPAAESGSRGSAGALQPGDASVDAWLYPFADGKGQGKKGGQGPSGTRGSAAGKDSSPRWPFGATTQHEADLAGRRDAAGKPPCFRFYLPPNHAMVCKLGNSCSYSHSIEYSSADKNSMQILASKREQELVKMNQEKGQKSPRSKGGGRGKSPRSHSNVDTSQIPCQYFAKGTCRHGESCKFSHAVRTE